MRKLKVISAFVVLAFILSACPGHVPRSPVAIYTGTRAAFNNYFETYLNARDLMPDGPEKVAMRNKMEPMFEKGVKALDNWDKAIGTDDEFVREKAVNAIIDMIVLELIERDLLK